jgi:hypothetical protein
MHFRKLLDPTCFSAEDFIDDHFNPVKKVLTIKNVTQDKPPNGGKLKGCFYFEEDPRKAFLGNKEIKKIGRELRETETDNWKGAKLQITCGPKKNPSGGEDTTGMVVLRAAFPPGHKHAKTTTPEDDERSAIKGETT